MTRVFIKLSSHPPLSPAFLDFLVAPVIQKVDSAFLWVNLCPVDSAITETTGWRFIPVDGAIQCLNNWGLVVRSLSYFKTVFFSHYVLFKSFDCELCFCDRSDLSGNR